MVRIFVYIIVIIVVSYHNNLEVLYQVPNQEDLEPIDVEQDLFI